MKLTCRYCGYCVEYENCKGWFPEYVRKIDEHMIKDHLKFSAIEKRGEDGALKEIIYGMRIDPGYSDHLRADHTGESTHRIESTIHRPQELEPYRPYDPPRKLPNC